MPDSETTIEAHAKGSLPGNGSWKLKFATSAPVTLVIILWSMEWLYLTPDSKFVPLAVTSGILGYLLARSMNSVLVTEKDNEITRRDNEIARMAANRDKLLAQLLENKQSSSSEPPPAKKKKGRKQ